MLSQTGIRSKILATQEALESWRETSALYPTLANEFIDAGINYLEVKYNDTALQQNDVELERLALEVFIGSIVAALAMAQTYSANDTKAKLQDPDSLEGKRFYPHTWTELEATYFAQHKISPELTKTQFILFCGAGVLNRDLSFDIDKLKPQLSYRMYYLLRVIQAQLYGEKQLKLLTKEDMVFILAREKENFFAADKFGLADNERLERTFQRAINVCDNSRDEVNKNKFKELIAQLREKSLDAYNKDNEDKNFDGLLQLAQGVEQLAKKIGDNTLRQEDCVKFKALTETLPYHSWCAELVCTMFTIAVAIAVGLTVGYLIAGTSGLAIGGLALFAVSGTTEAFLAKRKFDQEPARQLLKLSEQTVKPKL